MASLPDAAKFALFVAVGCVQILKAILEFVDGNSPRNPAVDTAVGLLLVVLPVSYLLGVILVYLHVTPAPAAPLPPAALRRFAGVACITVSALLLFLAVPLISFLFLAAGGR